MSTNDRILSHLCFLAVWDHEVILNYSGQQIIGYLEPPREDNTICFAPQGNQVPSRLNQDVKIRYSFRDFGYAFQTQVLSFDSLGRWHLQVPKAIKSKNIKLTHSYDAFCESGFELELLHQNKTSQFPLVTISTYGLRALFDPYRTALKLKEIVQVKLILPTWFRSQAYAMEVRGILSFSQTRRVVNLRFSRLPLADRKEIASGLRDWDKHKTRPSF